MIYMTSFYTLLFFLGLKGFFYISFMIREKPTQTYKGQA